MDFKAVYEQASIAIDELLSRANAKAGDIIVIGCSTSEVAGKMIGTGSNALAAKTIMDAVLPKIQEKGLVLSCSMLRAPEPRIGCRARMCRKIWLYGSECDSAAARGRSVCRKATGRFKDYTMVESIESKAALGMDIGGTFIGMHLRPVVVPIHTQNRKIGEANRQWRAHAKVCGRRACQVFYRMIRRRRKYTKLFGNFQAVYHNRRRLAFCVAHHHSFFRKTLRKAVRIRFNRGEAHREARSVARGYSR